MVLRAGLAGGGLDVELSGVVRVGGRWSGAKLMVMCRRPERSDDCVGLGGRNGAVLDRYQGVGHWGCRLELWMCVLDVDRAWPA